MGTNQTLPHLDKMVEELLKDIKKIESEGKAQISDKIMERLRGETIFLRKSYVNAKKTADHCTIDPNKCIDINVYDLEDGVDEDKINLIKNGIIAIKGNSFGPYYPNEYFKETTFKVLWLLKESYIERPSFDAGDRGGHNQAAEYAASGVKGNETHENLVAYTRKLLSILNGIDKNASDEEVMKHICILEANYFPGLALKSKNSDDTLISKWLPSAKNTLYELICFYDADIVIGGGNYILNYFCEGSVFHWCGKDDYSIIQTDNKYKNYIPLKIKEDEIDNSWPLRNAKNTKHSLVRTKKSTFYGRSIQTNKGHRYWINTYHPRQSNSNEQQILEQDILNSAQTILKDCSN